MLCIMIQHKGFHYLCSDFSLKKRFRAVKHELKTMNETVEILVQQFLLRIIILLSGCVKQC